MALNYGNILNQIALRAGDGGSIAGSTMTAVESNYNNASFGASQIDNPRFPFSAQKDALILAEEKLSIAIASNPRSPYRNSLSVFSSGIANRATVPSADSMGNKRIGVIGHIKDASNGTLLTEKPLQEVERIIRLGTSDALTSRYYHYALRGATIVHTRSGNVTVEMCVYNRDTQKTAVNAKTAALLPDVFEELYICGALAHLFAGDEAPDTIQQYVRYFEDGIARLEKLGE